ncbi:alpha/beta fold hydrolase [Burkholderia seminalis]|uniref:alpha/beta fold hydrolase n=1 Tax=Burkholderia seminalis TaxID=488731 RepID=UPI00084F65FA|nr:alpha/beta fold hydrolase [Burkholderia seminalis]
MSAAMCLRRNHEMRPRNEVPVKVVASERLTVSTSRGAANVPLFTGGTAARATATQVVVMLHGRLRDADAYLRSTQRALDASTADAKSVMLAVPQFLATADVAYHRLADACLHWEWTSWMGGLDAVGPAPLSSFDVLDALVEHYVQGMQSGRYPKLREIVIAGHSGGAQVAHRHAILSNATACCLARGVKVRYVIANPSSYVYFDAWRPHCEGIDRTACAGFNEWKYGTSRLPRYADGLDAQSLERRYVDHDVTYLLGAHDDDPAHPALDRSCEAMMQGPHRLARGRAYYAYLRARHPALRHVLHEVQGAGHSGDAMFVSQAGVCALFGPSVRLAESGVEQAGGAVE